jgi:hypothetical protein
LTVLPQAASDSAVSPAASASFAEDMSGEGRG